MVARSPNLICFLWPHRDIMDTNDFESLRRENEELRCLLRAKTCENSELSTQIGRLKEVVEDLKQDKQTLRENASHLKESLVRLKEETTTENSQKNAKIRGLEILLKSAKQSMSVSHSCPLGVMSCSSPVLFQHPRQHVKVESPATPHVTRSNVSRSTIRVQVWRLAFHPPWSTNSHCEL